MIAPPKRHPGFIMKKLSVELENCYGIKKLNHEFDFTTKRAYAIYAPNGSMKSSFAETFKNIAEGSKPCDRIFTNRVSVFKILDEKGKQIPPENVLVLPPYSEFFQPSERTATLLVNHKLRQQFEKLTAEMEEAKEGFLKTMRAQSGSKKDLEQEISITFTKAVERDSFWKALFRVEREIEEQKDAPFADVQYDRIFEDKVQEFLRKKEVKAALNEYITRYNELIAGSTFFKQGIFEYYNASQVAKTLAKNGFFSAAHSVMLNSTEKREISTQKELEDVVSAELEGITQDKKLKQQFDAIKKLLDANETMRGFQNYLCDHATLLPELANIDLFRERIWQSYFKKHEVAYKDLLGKYNKVKEELKKIFDSASKERTLWEQAISLFNDRFFVPFELEARNRVDVMLGNESVLDLGYRFKDGNDETPIERDALVKSLSQGERKALYILNVIFEIEVRKQTKSETLFVVDDIADSFDYKNKYAIVQYLQEISKAADFKQIILTHNFDFFRTIEQRVVPYDHCLMATKDATGITLNPSEGIKDIFNKKWKRHFFTSDRERVASIPFMRNLIEYVRGVNDQDYLKLTSLLHWKADSHTITQAELDAIYNRLFGGNGAHANPTGRVIDLIMQEANGCLGANQGVNFEIKIVLSIAVRFLADKFMASKINEPAFVAAITSNQTSELFDKFQQKHGGDSNSIKVLENVRLMTPQNLHLNAFMYEPILDMSDEHLRKLYQDVRALK